MTYPIKKLGEVVELQYGKGILRADRKSDGLYPVYGANGELDRTDKYLVEGEAIIIGRKGSAGELTRVSGKFWPSDVTYYVFGNKLVDIDYLLLFFKSINLPKLAVGVKPGINRNRVYEIEIPLPPIKEQKKIVARIEKKFAKIDEAARLRAESISAIDQLLPAALHEIFSSAESKGWKVKTLGDTCVIQAGGTPSKSVAKYWEGGDIPWLRSEACRDEVVDHSGKFITRDGLGHSSARMFKPRTTLIALVGATIGRTGFLTFESSTNQNIAGLYPKDEGELIPGYLFAVARGLYSEFLRIGAGKFKMANLTFVKSLKIPLPPLVEQKEIVKKLNALSEKVKALQELQSAQAADLKALKQSILHEAFSGGVE